jgi:hypothetical protein
MIYHIVNAIFSRIELRRMSSYERKEDSKTLIQPTWLPRGGQE